MPKSVALKKTARPRTEQTAAKTRAGKMKKPFHDNAEGKVVKHQKAAKGGDAKSRKEKVVRDSFTMPESEYELIAAIKRRCIANGIAAKSEVLRAAICSFAAQSDGFISAALGTLAIIKTGRPPKDSK